MNKNLILIIVGLVIVFGIIALVGTRDVEEIDPEEALDEEKAEEIAEEWIRNESLTYVYDGFDLRIEEVEELVEGRLYGLTFLFRSRAAGYGDRTDKIVAQVITDHEMYVVVERGEVTSAVTDEVYDEMEADFVDEEARERFDPEAGEITVYFMEVVEGQEQIVSVVREIPTDVEAERAAIENLLEGPSSEEKEEGLTTSIPEGTELLSIEIEDGLATVNFNEKLQEGVAGSAWVISIRDQIEKTLIQFNSVENVLILVEGESEDILQP